ncbi:predicted protein [Naegleria gruberi]|uniref:Predicted protein n=1 Tax=Naegleria gruberi TaxID=5762 RepID=D2VFR9_NAEGR|nr:uncharacterized protein NAEGRDRAFT_67721 [Naegleria gruberi]EFC44518.1 predicted protein [Naegleria gruberi]|eukprot:XP_002677262.1 predicted protein [Naegleria gruberi strain NEG-M]
MSSLVSYLFDPESDVLSKLPPIESSIKERKIVEKLTRLSRKNELSTTKSRANTVSPVMTNVLMTSPLRDKNMDFAENVSKKLIRLVGNIFSDEMRTKLMNVYMKKFK